MTPDASRRLEMFACRIRVVWLRILSRMGSERHSLLPVRTWRARVEDQGKSVHAESLKAVYSRSGESNQEDTFALIRVLGNDLPPRHSVSQARTNLRFILENEPELPGCKRHWVVNRIVDPVEEAAILELLEAHGQGYTRIPFSIDEYALRPWDFDGLPWPGWSYSEELSLLPRAMQARSRMRLYRHKNNYVMNNNGARNVALATGRAMAKWVLPWDGNCFVTAEAWQELVRQVRERPWYPYFVVPMARIEDNEDLLQDGFRPEPREEPQLIFRRDTRECFDEAHPYGRRPKVALFWRLGVPGPWDRWRIEPWDLPPPEFSPDAGQFAYAGWVARLTSGEPQLESNPGKGLVQRGVARIEAVTNLLDRLDEEVARRTFHRDRLLVYREEELAAWREAFERGACAVLREKLEGAAQEALSRGPYSVVDKLSLPPSGDPQDYWHPAPYYWPSPVLPSLLPYIRRDGRRVPGTRLYEPGSERYDRTRLQRLFDDTTVLALAGYMTGEPRYAAHGARLVRRWFINPDTRMNPHLRYAQVRWGWNGNRGSPTGLIEMKDLYFFLDAVRLLERAGALGDDGLGTFRAWLSDYVRWLLDSDQGRREWRARNNHGTYYDLQVAAIAAYLDDVRLLLDTLRTSQERLLQQFDADGRQPEELRRNTSAHYCCFNLQGWVHLARIADAASIDLMNSRGEGQPGLRRAFEWLLGFMGCSWPFRQIDEFDAERFNPLWYAARTAYGAAALPAQVDPGPLARQKSLFFPHHGVKPFWMFAYRPG